MVEKRWTVRPPFLNLPLCGQGHLKTVIWLYENMLEHSTSIYRNAIDVAAKYGHLEIVKWLHENIRDMYTKAAMVSMIERTDMNRSEGCTTFAATNTVQMGHIKILKWLHTNQPEGWPKEPIYWPRCSDHPEIVEWLRDNIT
jgi:hypothetical protein